ncbi:MAG: hypothetical protein NTY38_04445 [Acidobacteria bacterium]|nr:hypothetical protein [Acidobacteriota bacterium]
MMLKFVCSLALAGIAAFGQYKTEAGGAVPREVAPSIAAALDKTGVKIMGPAGEASELWLRSALPAGKADGGEGITFTEIPLSAVIGVIRFAAGATDRRGQPLKAGVYTLRYNRMPVDGAHQGAAPQRDFLVLAPAEADQDLNAAPAYADLMNLGRKASGTPHPAVLSIWKPDSDYVAGLSKQGEHDQVYMAKIGGQAIAIILVGKAEGQRVGRDARTRDYHGAEHTRKLVFPANRQAAFRGGG